MAINQNHLSEELNGNKCAIVEKNCSKARVEFLQSILEYNGFQVVIVPSPPPKPPVPTAANQSNQSEIPVLAESVPLPAETYTVGVTDLTFNSVNAIFGRLLRLPGGQVVTLAYWQQQSRTSDDSTPYFETRDDPENANP